MFPILSPVSPSLSRNRERRDEGELWAEYFSERARAAGGPYTYSTGRQQPGQLAQIRRGTDDEASAIARRRLGFPEVLKEPKF